MHDGGALREVRTEPDTIGITDAYPRGDDVIDHAGETVDAVDNNRSTLYQFETCGSEGFYRAGAKIGPYDVL